MDKSDYTQVYSWQWRSAETHWCETAALGSEAAEAAAPVPQLSTFPVSHLQGGAGTKGRRWQAGEGGAADPALIQTTKATRK